MCRDFITVLLVRYACELCNRGRDRIGTVYLRSTCSENLRGFGKLPCEILALPIVLESSSWNKGGGELNVRFLSICFELQDGRRSLCMIRRVRLLYVSTQILDIMGRRS
jgi:hypothetical protein